MIKQNKYDPPLDPYFGQVWYDRESKKTYEYIEVGEGSIDINNDPINGVWAEINWDNKRIL
tara:strand:+ start:211 stop:393 length:183 start_codon:yes stop_codon:yes gene_type:complete